MVQLEGPCLRHVETVANGLEGACPLRCLIAQPLGMALHCLARSNYCFSYPSGIGILANVLHTPGLMLLPWLLSGLEKAYADPCDLASQRYRAWANPSPEQAFEWFKNVSMPQLLAENKGNWLAR